jgi:hypothetical protein
MSTVAAVGALCHAMSPHRSVQYLLSSDQGSLVRVRQLGPRRSLNELDPGEGSHSAVTLLRRLSASHFEIMRLCGLDKTGTRQLIVPVRLYASQMADFQVEGVRGSEVEMLGHQSQ